MYTTAQRPYTLRWYPAPASPIHERITRTKKFRSMEEAKEFQREWVGTSASWQIDTED